MALEARGKLLVAGVPARDAALGEELRSYQNVRHAAFSGFCADGLFIQTRFAESSQVHHVASPLAMREQMTFIAEPVKGCSPSPPAVDPPGFIFGADSGGDEQTQFYFFNRQSRKKTRLTDGKSMNRSATWSDDGRVAFSSNQRDGEHFDLYLLDSVFGSPEPRLVWVSNEPGYLQIQGFEGDWVLLLLYVSVTDSRLFLLDLATSSCTHVAPAGPQKASIGCAVLLPGGVGAIYSSDEGSEFKTLRSFDAQTRSSRELLAEPIAWDVEDVAVGLEDTIVIFNQDGVSTFYHAVRSAATLHTGGSLTMQTLGWCDDIGLGVAGRAAFSKYAPRTFGFCLVTATGPSDVYTSDLGSLSRRPVQWTRSEVGGLDTAAFVQPQVPGVLCSAQCWRI